MPSGSSDAKNPPANDEWYYRNEEALKTLRSFLKHRGTESTEQIGRKESGQNRMAPFFPHLFCTSVSEYLLHRLSQPLGVGQHVGGAAGQQN